MAPTGFDTSWQDQGGFNRSGPTTSNFGQGGFQQGGFQNGGPSLTSMGRPLVDSTEFHESDPLMAKVPQKKTTRLADTVKQRAFLIIWLGPFAAFLFTLGLWEYGFMYHCPACIIWSVWAIFLGAYNVVHNRRGSVPFMVALLALPAVILASVAGLYLYDQYTIFPEFYANSRKYTNVVPSQPASAVSDAGKLTFSAESYVDISQASGLMEESGVRYCVAPVRDGTGIDRIQFWAVGVGCCTAQGGFYCDAASDLSARGGVVVFDNNGYFETARWDFYEKARQKAQAEHSLQTVAAPLYIRWVKETNLDMLSNSYRNYGIMLTIFIGILSLGLLFGAAYSLYNPEMNKGL